MNWYHRFKLAQEYGHPESYLDIGHQSYMGETGCDEWLWAIVDGKMQIEKAGKDLTHNLIFPMHSVDYYGRYSDCRKQVSIIVQGEKAMYGVPQAVVRMVERAFPEAVGTYVFANGEMMAV